MAFIVFFSSIKNAIWGDKDKAKAAAPAPAPAAAAPAPAKPVPLTEAEMAARIGAMPNADKFNLQTSIVDLMKMVGLDASHENRKELTGELSMEGYEGTAGQNIALHHAVMNLLALDGGKVGGILED
jgi:hypothetical protein